MLCCASVVQLLFPTLCKSGLNARKQEKTAKKVAHLPFFVQDDNWIIFN
ncbi:hypothetical protein CHISP_0029 [Chitinispirillum alkaliphilum]|nr:hypothetical protein CHISP_0029 [Chitinispirillum alkaliphilum]